MPRSGAPSAMSGAMIPPMLWPKRKTFFRSCSDASAARYAPTSVANDDVAHGPPSLSPMPGLSTRSVAKPRRDSDSMSAR